MHAPSTLARGVTSARDGIPGGEVEQPAQPVDALIGAAGDDQAIDRFIAVPNPNPGAILLLAAGYFFLSLVSFGLTYGQEVLLQQTGQGIVRAIRLDLFRHLHRLSLRYFDQHSAGRIITNVVNDTESLNNFFTQFLPNTLRGVLSLVLIMFFMLKLDLGIALYCFLLVPVVLTISISLRRVLTRIYREIRSRLAATISSLAENLAGMAIVQIFHQEAKQQRKSINRDIEPAVPLEQADLQDVAVHPGLGRADEPAAIEPGVRDDHRGGFATHTVNMDLEARKTTFEELRETGEDVRALAQHALERRRDRGHDEGVEPHACHQHEFPAVDVTKADRARIPQDDRCGDFGRMRAEADLGGQDVGRSHRNERDGRRRRRQAVEHFVHGAIAACHHEKPNGTGYPWGFRAADIPLGGKILAIVDIFEALTAKDRPYKPAIPIEKALKILDDEEARGGIDSKLYALFKDRRIYRLYESQTGFVTRPAPARTSPV